MWKSCFISLFISLHLVTNCYSKEDVTECMKQQMLVRLALTRQTISKAKQHIPICSGIENGAHSDTSHCIERGETLAYLETAANLVSVLMKRNYSFCTTGKTSVINKNPMDCLEVLENGHKESGVYTIWPRSHFFCNTSLEVLCDMETDGGGWTVLERKRNMRSDADYWKWEWHGASRASENYFGDITEDFYVGKKNARALTNQGCYELRDDEEDTSGNRLATIYNKYRVDYESKDFVSSWDGTRVVGGDENLFDRKRLSSTVQKIRRFCP